MHSRAHILLKRDLQELKTNSYKGISAFPVTDNMMEWEASIEGLQNTICEGLSYQVTIHFTSEYNFVPPTVKFITIPFHPNVDTHSGQPCIDFLDNPKIWSTRYTLGSILLALQVMLSNPELENPVNLEAAKVLTSTEPTYRSINLRLCEQSLSLRKETSTGFQSSGKQSKFIKEVSFHNYYKTWIGIATSKSSTHEKTLLLKRPTFIKEYYKLKTLGQKHPENLNLKSIAALARFGRGQKRPSKANYPSLCSTTSQDISVPQPKRSIVAKVGETMEQWENEGMEGSQDNEDTEESWEEEVEDLVTWTDSLNLDKLDQD